MTKYLNLPPGGPAVRPAPRRRSLFRLAGAALACLLAAGASAFPPAPHYTIYGVVRDQVGATLAADGAVIILIKDNAEIGRAPVTALRGDRNYELNIRIDQQRPASRIYSARAVPALGVFSLAVELNGQRFFPIEVAGTLRVGQGGERVRLDLNLGADLNRDGLPDAWQEWQLYQAGRRPGMPGWDINLVTRDGDFDGDGISNFHEYVAGTFAGDATERFELRITGKSAGTVSFEFFSITGKVYGLEHSPDLANWTAVAFALAPGGPAQTTFQAPDVNLVSAYVPAAAGAAGFYRLTVR